ncbi:MAG TPA: hypothetical protein VGS96_19210 [Thermoanaerobaculia bacterium]|nr:hypothetical protein [Thermoanaerobaculia bacterium]
MARRELLPGITADDCPPVAVFDSRRAITRARRRMILHDAAQFILLAGVDWLFIRWPYTHIPSFDRAHSVVIVAVLNAALLTYAIVSRMFPRWSARRIATTWCLAERARFFAQSWRE